MSNLNLFGSSDAGTARKLSLVHARFKDVKPFSFEIFDGFSSLRVLTYSAPETLRIPTIVQKAERIAKRDAGVTPS